MPASSIWGFFNANAAAIQAMASIVTAAVTVALVVVTWRYVHLSARIAEAARAELLFHEEEEAEKWRELNAQTRLIRALLSTLPAEDRGADALARQAVSWDQADVARLQRLAARLDRSAGERAATVVTAMTWLAERVREIKSADPESGYNWAEFPWARWTREIATARSGLDAIAATVNRKLAA